MGLRSRDSIARANSVVNERAARRGVRGLKTTFRGKKEAAHGEASVDEVNATAVGKKRDARGRARIRWPDQSSASEVRAPEEDEEDEEARARREDEATTTGASGGDDVESSTTTSTSKPKPKRPPLETLIEYEVTESEGSLDTFQRLPSAGAGEHVGAYGDADSSDDSFDTEDDVQAMRQAMQDLKYGENDKCCCVVQ